MQKDPLVLPNKSCKAYFLLDGVKVYFSGDFDSGNLEKAQQISSLTYRVTPAYDKTRNTTHKNFFHFKVHGFRHCTIKFIVTRAHILEPLIRTDSSSDVYHPVVRRHPHLPFEKIMHDVKIYYNSVDEPQLSFPFTFQQQNWVQFAFTYPYAYQDCEHLLSSLQTQYHNHPDIYLHQEVLIRTSQTRKTHLLTITDRRNLTREREPSIDGILNEGERAFRVDRPRVVLSARVHPGEAPASHCMEGALRFLLNEQDYRSYLLRKYFQFCVIPMVNPEGVFEGMFRNDLNGDNLNRMYLHCDKRKHKSIWAIAQWLLSLDRVDFFFDLHAHPSRKGFFIYGNAFDEFLQQVEAQIFSKMLEYNCPYFQNLDCIYSEKAMTAKDKYDQHTKQGCGRVHYQRRFGLIHSYTVQCGYFGPTRLNRYPPQRDFLTGSQLMCTYDWERISMKEYTPETYMFMGKSLLISILDLFHVNPYSRISTSDFKSVHSLRKFTAQRVYNQVERFRLIDSNCYRKIKDVANLIELHYYLPRFKKYGLTINQNYGMRHRKKTFSLNSRIYGKKLEKAHEHSEEHLQSGQEHRESGSDRQESSHPQAGDGNTSLQQIIDCKQLGGQIISTPSLPELHIKHHPPSSSFKRFRIAKSSSLEALQKHKNNLQAMNRQNEEIALILHARSPYEKLLRDNDGLPSVKRMEKEIINELMKQKHKKEKKEIQNEGGSGRMDRLESFLRKESKGKFPFIHTETLER